MEEIRRKDRAVRDQAEIAKIVEKAKILRLGLLDGAFPRIVPLHFGFEYDAARDVYRFYAHGAKTGRKLDLIRANPNACVELEADVALASGGDSPCEYGAFYSSFLGWGRAAVVENVDEKKRALTLLMRNQTGRTFEFSDAAADSVAVVRIDVDQYSAKARRR